MKGFDIVTGFLVLVSTALTAAFIVVSLYAMLHFFVFVCEYFEVRGWVVLGAFCALNMLFNGPMITRIVTRERV